MNIVLDTNVLVSGLINPHGVPGEIVRMVAFGKITVLYDTRILMEYWEVLRRPRLRIETSRAAALIDQIQDASDPVLAVPLPMVLPDPDDQPFLEVAAAAQASFLVTGNTRHFPEKRYLGVRVVTPKEWLEEYRQTG